MIHVNCKISILNIFWHCFWTHQSLKWSKKTSFHSFQQLFNNFIFYFLLIWGIVIALGTHSPSLHTKKCSIERHNGIFHRIKSKTLCTFLNVFFSPIACWLTALIHQFFFHGIHVFTNLILPFSASSMHVSSIQNTFGHAPFQHPSSFLPPYFIFPAIGWDGKLWGYRVYYGKTFFVLL